MLGGQVCYLPRGTPVHVPRVAPGVGRQELRKIPNLSEVREANTPFSEIEKLQ